MATTTPVTGSEGAKGAKRRSGIPTPASRAAAAAAARAPEMRRIAEDGRDSGLSSECTTPTNGSPPPRQPKQQQQQQQQQQHEQEQTSQATIQQQQQKEPGLVCQIPRRKMVDIIAASKARLQESERLSNNRTTRLLHSRSSTESPRSLDSTRSRQVFSPLRPPRNVQSPSLDSGDEGSLRLERGTYSYMFQDIVSIKTMLLKLKRVLQETETLNPFDNTLKNGLFYNLNDGNATTDASTSPNDGRETVADELADLRRQVVFLQGQVDDKDRTIQSLQSQLAKYQKGSVEASSDTTVTHNGRGESIRETSNAATQTEKLRPVSAGPSILQGLPQDNGMGPLVSWNDSWSGQQQQQQQQHQQQPSQRHSSSGGQELSSSSSTSSNSSGSGGGGGTKLASRRASSSDVTAQSSRPSSLRGLRLPNGQQQLQHLQQLSSPPDSPRPRAARTKSAEVAAALEGHSPRSAIPTPRRLAASTLIPRAARAVSATGRAHNS